LNQEPEFVTIYFEKKNTMKAWVGIPWVPKTLKPLSILEER